MTLPGCTASACCFRRAAPSSFYNLYSRTPGVGGRDSILGLCAAMDAQAAHVAIVRGPGSQEVLGASAALNWSHDLVPRRDRVRSQQSVSFSVPTPWS